MSSFECPCCNSKTGVEFDLHADGFAEDLFECFDCGAKWIYKHGVTELIDDSNAGSFLSQDEECTDGTCMNVI